MLGGRVGKEIKQAVKKGDYCQTYILTFDTIGSETNPRGRASTYVGYTSRTNIKGRLEEHMCGCGAHIMKAVSQIYNRQVTLVATIPGGAGVEQAIKARKNTSEVIEQIKKMSEQELAEYNITVWNKTVDEIVQEA